MNNQPRASLLLVSWFVVLSLCVMAPLSECVAQDRKSNGSNPAPNKLLPTSTDIFKFDYKVEGLAVSPNGSMLAFCKDEELVLVESSSGEVIFEQSGFPAIANSATHGGLKFSPDGRSLLVRDLKNLKYVTFSNDFEEIKTEIKLPKQKIFSRYSIAGDASMLVTTGQNAIVQLYDLTTGDEVGEIQPSEIGIIAIASLHLSDNGGHLIVVGGRHVALFDTKTRKPLQNFQLERRAYAGKLSSDGSIFVSQGSRDWKVVELSSGNHDSITGFRSTDEFAILDSNANRILFNNGSQFSVCDRATKTLQTIPDIPMPKQRSDSWKELVVSNDGSVAAAKFYSYRDKSSSVLVLRMPEH